MFSLKPFSEEIKKNLFNLSARSIIQIFKKELNDNPTNFLKTYENIKDIKAKYNYQLLSKEAIISHYKKEVKKNLINFEYKIAIVNLTLLTTLDKEDYTFYASLGMVYYELATEQKATKGIDNYIKSIEKYKQAHRLLTLLERGSSRYDTSSILESLSDSYLELLEVYLIENEEEKYSDLSIEFKELLKRNKDALKVEEMFQILNYIYKNKKQPTRLMIQRWERRYRRDAYSWDFDELFKWANKEDNKFLTEYLHYFEEEL